MLRCLLYVVAAAKLEKKLTIALVDFQHLQVLTPINYFQEVDGPEKTENLQYLQSATSS